ncbi:MAG TPA: putative leader peptide [Streptosporangiaceae bacterium]
MAKSPAGHTIVIVAGSSRAGATGRERRVQLALTRRRAVDFCRVATALC